MATRSPDGLLRAAIVVALLLGQTSFAGIWLTTITGTCRDEHGNPLPNTTLYFTDQANAGHFQVSTDSAGAFTYIATPPAIYTVQVARKGKSPTSFHNVVIEWSPEPLVLEISLEDGTAKITRTTPLPAFFRSDESPPALIALDTTDQTTVAAINQQLATARQLSNEGDWQGAIRALWSAIEIDSKRDLPWALLGAAYYNAATHSADDSKTQLEESVRSYRKALELAPTAAYHNNLGNVYVKLKQYEGAVEQYTQAQSLNSDQSALYSQNMGMALVEEAQSQPNDSAIELLHRALEAFDRVLAVAPPRDAEVLYWKGLCQLRLAANGRGSFDGIAGAFQQYLKLAPQGRFAAEAEGMLKALPGADGSKRQ